MSDSSKTVFKKTSMEMGISDDKPVPLNNGVKSIDAKPSRDHAIMLY